MTLGTRTGRGPESKSIDQEKLASLQRAGQKAFKAGDFQRALESFTQVRPSLFT
jgi:hypothetical protein